MTVADDGATYTLDNGLVTAKIDKTSGAILSLRYKGLEMLGTSESRSNGYWSLPGTSYGFGAKHDATITQDPAQNGGGRATVSVSFTYDGDPDTVPADVGLRYSLGRGETALALEGDWVHRTSYPNLSFGPGRFAAKLNDAVFDWMSVDARRNMEMITASDWNHGTPLNEKEARRMNTGILKGQVEHKYDYAAVQFDTPAYGWSSTAHHVGLWLVNPSNEYMSGGPTKMELSEHRDATFTTSLTAPAPPTLLNVWKGPHYGGTVLDVRPGEAWSKVIGPFFLYCNSGPTPAEMWHDALDQAASLAAQWPFAWVTSPDYLPKPARGTVTGRIVLRDPQAPAATMTNLLVGVTHPDYPAPGGGMITWQTDSKYYQFWARGDAQGNFTLANVRPGTYTLHAFANGVLGELAQANVTVTAKKTLALGRLTWTPVRYGRQLWEIGVPDRTAGEFRHGDHYWHWGIYAEYPTDFPQDVRYVIGQSDYHKDWNLMQVPRAHDNTGKGRGDATPWTVQFSLPQAAHGRATLRLAFAGTEAKSLAIGVNGQPVADLTGFPNTMAIHRDADRSEWQERDVAFDAALLKSGANTLSLTVPAGPVTGGMEYDYLRLELDETVLPPPLGASVSPPVPNVPPASRAGGDD